jgi:hypothetical protein
MLTRISALALAAAFSVAALASTGASAKPVMGIIINKPKPVLGVVVKPPIVTGVVIKPPIVTGIVINHDHDHDHDHDWDGPHFGHYWWHHYQPSVVVREGVSAPVASVSTPVASTPAPCTCLTKQYLQDGSVLFKDVCTRESALATPAELRGQLQGNAQ